MVNQQRSGRFGSSLPQQQTQQEEVTPELIRDEPRVPEGRFGRSLKQTGQLRERAVQISSIRQEAIQEANRLESEFFSQNITIEQAEEEYAKVDPKIRQFIKTTPTVRRQLARQVLQDIENRIIVEQNAIQRLSQRGGSNADIEILERQQIIQELGELRDEAQSGAFRSEDLIGFAESRGRTRRSRAEAREGAEERLTSAGVPTRLAEQLLRTGVTRKTTLSEQEAQMLSPEAKQALGLKDNTAQLSTETRPKTVSELVAEGIPRDVAVKITSGQGIGLEDFYKLPKNVRQQTGLTRADFESGKQQIESSAIQELVQRIEDPNKSFFGKLVYGQPIKKTFRGKPVIVNPLTIPAFVEAGFRDAGTYASEKVVQFRSSDLNKKINNIGKIQIRGTSGTKLSDQTVKNIVSGAFDITTFSVPVVSQIRTASFSLDVAGRLTAGDKVVLSLKPSTKEVSVLEVAGAVSLPVLSASKFLREEVIISREGIKRPVSKGLTEIININQLEKQINVAQFTVKSTKESRKAFVVPRIDLIESKFFGLDIGKPSTASLPDLKLAFPRGRIIELEKASVSFLKTEKFLTSGGKVLGSLRGTDVGFVAFSGTGKGTPKVRLGLFRGELDKEVKLLKLVNPKKLSSVDKRLLEELTKDTSFSKQAEFFTGNTFTRDLFKIGKKDIKLISAGNIRIKKDGFIFDIARPSKRTTLRGRLAGVQESKINLEGNLGNKMLKEFQVLDESIAFADITFPSVPKNVRIGSSKKFIKQMDISPRRVDRLRGTTTRLEVDLPDLRKMDIDVIRPTGKKRTPFSITFPKQELKQIQKLELPDLSGRKAIPIQAMKGGLGLRAVKGLPSRSLTEKQLNSQLNKLDISGARAVTRSISSSSERQPTIEQTKLNSILMPKLQSKNITKLSTKNLSKQIGKLSPRLTTKLTSKLSTKLITKLTAKNITRTIPTLRIPKFPRNISPTSKIPFGFGFKQRPLRIPRRRQTTGRSDLALTEGFTARILNLKPLRIREKDIGKALARQQNLGAIRLRPMIIPDFSMRKKRRKR